MSVFWNAEGSRYSYDFHKVWETRRKNFSDVFGSFVTGNMRAVDLQTNILENEVDECDFKDIVFENHEQP